jgi:hypothetical protein
VELHLFLLLVVWRLDAKQPIAHDREFRSAEGGKGLFGSYRVTPVIEQGGAVAARRLFAAAG